MTPFAAVHESVCGTSRWFTATQCFVGYQGTADTAAVTPARAEALLRLLKTDPDKKCTDRPGRKGTRAKPLTGLALDASGLCC